MSEYMEQKQNNASYVEVRNHLWRERLILHKNWKSEKTNMSYVAESEASKEQREYQC